MKNKILKTATEKNNNSAPAKKRHEQFSSFSIKNTLKCIALCFIFTIISNFSATAQEWKKGKQDNILYAVPQQYNSDTTQLGVKVGIGTTNPQKALDVVGDVQIKGFLTVDSMRVLNNLHVGKHSLTFVNDSGDYWTSPPGVDMIQTTCGRLAITNDIVSTDRRIKVGIGTTTPQAQLHLFQSDSESYPSTPLDVYTLFTNDTNSNNTNGFQLGIAANGNAVLDQRQNLPMLFKTDSTERMRILSNGNISIGDTTADSKLTINSDSSGISGLQFTQLNLASTAGNANGKVLSLDSTGKVILVKDSGSGNVAACSSWASTYNNYVPKWSSSTSRELCKSLMYDNGFGIGIGTTSPQAKLHITGTDNQWLDISSSSNGAYMRLIANGSSNISQFKYKGKLYIAPYDSSLASIVFDQSSNVGIGADPVTGTKFYVAGTSKFGGNVSTTGNLGVGAVSSGAKLDVQGTSNFNGNMTVTGNVTVNGSGTYTGTWTDVSDQMFKTNVNSIYSALNTIKQLKPKSFYFDTANVYGLNFSNNKQYGFIAQDVETLLPELVSSTTKNADMDTLGNVIHPAVTYKTLNYNAFFGILTKGIQELQEKNDALSTKLNKQDSINASLQEQLNQLLNCCKNNEGRSHSNTSEQNYKTEGSGIANQTDVELNDIQTIVLEQNVPNPFAEQTTINYFLPEHTAKAQMLFYNAQGKLIQSVELVQKGKGQLNVFANDLSSGIYTYTLVVDGKIIETKKMVKQ